MWEANFRGEAQLHCSHNTSVPAFFFAFINGVLVCLLMALGVFSGRPPLPIQPCVHKSTYWRKQLRTILVSFSPMTHTHGLRSPVSCKTDHEVRRIPFERFSSSLPFPYTHSYKYIHIQQIYLYLYVCTYMYLYMDILLFIYECVFKHRYKHKYLFMCEYILFKGYLSMLFSAVFRRTVTSCVNSPVRMTVPRSECDGVWVSFFSCIKDNFNAILLAHTYTCMHAAHMHFYAQLQLVTHGARPLLKPQNKSAAFEIYGLRCWFSAMPPKGTKFSA